MDLPEFDQLELHHSNPPEGAILLAWAKLRATERGLLAFDWLVHVVRKPGHCTSLIDYLASAFLLSFEATLQVLKEEREQSFPNGFDAWLASQQQYTFLCRGLRTLRHLEAHVRPGQLATHHGRTAHSRFASGTDPGNTVAWQLPPISELEFQRLKHPKLRIQELPRWNALVADSFAADMMREGLTSLASLVGVGEQECSSGASTL